MAEFTYRAFISYSHRDESWARWLHRALESYRVPGKLVGHKTGAGAVPARIRPVFRDREDLSSASDLSESVKQALAESENLVVICSPQAVDSHWAGEEIREFARLGRGSRIFCLVVEGKPDSDEAGEACFPPALSHVGLSEPLAADVRSWADGKRLALLKLISGMLGIRLDDLRQRDQKRNRRIMMVTGLGILAAITLVVMTVISQVSSRHEREKAEQMATFIVGLGEQLRSDTDLETLAVISAEASGYFQDLDPGRLSPESGKNVALVLRQVARVSQLQGNPAEAMESYRKSHDILAALRKNYPEDLDLLYELGNAQYYIGNLHLKQNKYAEARGALRQYHLSTRALLDADPENPDWIMEHAYSHNNLAALQLDSGMGVDEATQTHLAEAIDLMEKAIELMPYDERILSDYANTLAYAADAQKMVCNLESALSLRTKVKNLAQTAVQSDPGNNDLIRRHAFAISGIATLQIQLGQLEAAEENLEQSVSLLQRLSAADPSNAQSRYSVVVHQVLLAGVIADNDKLQEAQSLLQKLESEFDFGGESAQMNRTRIAKYVEFLLAYADVEARAGDLYAAERHLQTALRLQLDFSSSQGWERLDRVRFLRTRFLWWQVNGQDFNDHLPGLPHIELAPAEGNQSCAEAEVAARMFVMEGDFAGASRQVNYLRERHYADPAFERFREQYGL